ncbi:RNA polymerase sigma factor [Flavobacterium sp. SM2513]|uniref:RNA polymerase sigma factor n=1 Tax=Flavobacterium sp. SM2513 TaxID=3424766 RepID=UPI003D7FD547
MNQSEFVILIQPFKDKVFRLARRLLISVEEAEDVTQEMLMRLWYKKESLQQYKSVEAFAMTMTKNYCLDQLKSKRASLLKIEQTAFKAEGASLQNQLEDSDSLFWVEKIIEKLPVQQKLIVQMRDIEQYDFEKIADILEMNETAIRVALSRARKTIRETMFKVHNYGIK